MEIYAATSRSTPTTRNWRRRFAEFGQGERAVVITNRENGRSRGFGLVTMPDAGEGNAAVEAINSADMGGRALKVNAARPKDR